jgi:hypothetical protein
MFDWLLGPTPGSLQNRDRASVDLYNMQVAPRMRSSEDRIHHLEQQVAALTTIVREMKIAAKAKGE